MTTNTDRRKQRLTAFIQRAWNEGEPDAVNYLADSYTIHHDPGDPWEGKTLDRNGFVDRLLQSRAAFPDQRFDSQHMVAEGDKVIMAWLWEGTHRAEIAGFAPSGKTVRMSGATVYFFDEEDRITGHWQIRDNLGVFQQLQRNAAPQG